MRFLFCFDVAGYRLISLYEGVKPGVRFYPSGHTDKLDVAVRRATLTGVNQTMGQVSFEYAEEFGCDIMEITAHSGARPSHAVWQGQLVSRSGKPGYLSLSDIGYGTGAGFMGWNCRHSWNPFFEGISERSYDENALKKLQEKDVEYKGVKYTEYEISQMQRSMERDIRATKRELAGLDEAVKEADGDIKAQLQEDFEKSAVRLKAKEAKIKDLLSQTDMLPDSSRVQVLGFGKSTSGKAVSSASKHYKQWLHDIGATEGAPKTLAGYYDWKYNKAKEFELLMKYSLDVKTGWVSPNVGYSKYRYIFFYIENNIIGQTTVNGIVITQQSKHFMQRICGTMCDPDELKKLKVIRRSGVEVESIRDALIKGKAAPLSKKNHSQLFIGNKCAASVNPTTGKLIQCNPIKEVKP